MFPPFGVILSQYQTRFTDLAGTILGLCLSSHDSTCEAAVKILFSMIYAEYVLHGRFGGIQAEIFAKLDELVRCGMGEGSALTCTVCYKRNHLSDRLRPGITRVLCRPAASRVRGVSAD